MRVRGLGVMVSLALGIMVVAARGGVSGKTVYDTTWTDAAGKTWPVHFEGTLDGGKVDGVAVVGAQSLTISGSISGGIAVGDAKTTDGQPVATFAGQDGGSGRFTGSLQMGTLTAPWVASAADAQPVQADQGQGASAAR